MNLIRLRDIEHLPASAFRHNNHTSWLQIASPSHLNMKTGQITIDEPFQLVGWCDVSDGRLACAEDVPTGTECIGISGNLMTRNGFIKNDPALGCRNVNPDGSANFCCTFAVVAITERVTQ